MYLHVDSYVKVFLVTGGTKDGTFNLKTTELLRHGVGDKEWVNSGELPTVRKGLRGATLNNKVIVTGK